ncbi:class I SAM-dependent methyltransferase [Amycolatopsis sp. NPDC058986]|uniref:class I SAM-dependent methyltransferase n=1 Tax=unclassified Amycolatopsis TaxID=2618356 RepID=UPI003671B64D
MARKADRLAAAMTPVLGEPLPVRIRAWDGSEAGPRDAPALVFRHRRALRRLLWRPGKLGLARAWVAGDLDVDGDLFDALERLAGFVDEHEVARSWHHEARRALATVRDPQAVAALREMVVLAGGPGFPPAPPPEENRRRRGARHSVGRDRAAISHHYDVGNDFYALLLGPSMVYSCAYWNGKDGPLGTLEEAQAAKLDLVCRKLDLREGDRLLDVGCGWGSMALHAARHFGARAVGITISAEQAALARERVNRAGLSDRVDIRIQDYREITDGPYDAICSIGMAEHVGSARYREYTDALYGLLEPGGRLLNHQISRRPTPDETTYRLDEFIDRYVFPDGELMPLGTTVKLIEDTGFEIRHVEALREHYGPTLRAWVRNLETHWTEATGLATPGRARVWRLYLAASALAFEQNRIGVNQVLAVRPARTG